MLHRLLIQLSVGAALLCGCALLLALKRAAGGYLMEDLTLHSYPHEYSNLTDPYLLGQVLHPAPPDLARYAERLADYEPRLQREQKYNYYYGEDRQEQIARVKISHGIDLLYLGRYAEARDLYLRLERLYPGRYAVAANLGACYELLGDDTRALHWVSESMRRSPGDSWDAEWLETRVLEAKLALATEPAWLSAHHVLGAEFGSAAEPRLITPAYFFGHSGATVSDQEIVEALASLLSVRLKFTPAPDPIVADLLTDLGNALLHSGAPRAASMAYARAKEYGATGSLLTRRVAYADLLGQAEARSYARSKTSPLKRSGLDIAFNLGAIGLIAYIGFLFIRRRRLLARSA
jgi:tetratricopeptide (TPR) repeat protein